MKRILIFILLFMFIPYCFGQKVKNITEKFPKSNQISKIYSVLRSNKKVKHGEYISYFRLPKSKYKTFDNKEIEDYIKDNGKYVNGNKEGEWIEKVAINKVKKGKYLNGKKVGVWTTLYNDNIIETFDYDLNKKVGIWLTYRENGKVVERFDYDKNIKLKPMIRLRVNYPPKAREEKVSGEVVVKYHINDNCEVDSFEIIKPLSVECDKEVNKRMVEFKKLYKQYNENCKDSFDNIIFKFMLN